MRKKIKKSKSERAAAANAQTAAYFFSTPSAAKSAAQVIEAQLRPFKKVNSEVKADGAGLTVLLSATAENRSTASLCAKRLAEWMQKLQTL